LAKPKVGGYYALLQGKSGVVFFAHIMSYIFLICKVVRKAAYILIEQLKPVLLSLIKAVTAIGAGPGNASRGIVINCLKLFSCYYRRSILRSVSGPALFKQSLVSQIFAFCWERLQNPKEKKIIEYSLPSF